MKNVYFEEYYAFPIRKHVLLVLVICQSKKSSNEHTHNRGLQTN